MLKKYSWLIFTIIAAGFIIGQYFYKQPKFVNGETAIDTMFKGLYSFQK